MTDIIANRLKTIRKWMAQQDVQGFIVPHTDEFGSEYLPQNAERLAWITGFTGSSGTAVILEGTAMAMTDGRYTIQIKHQVNDALYDICDMAHTTIGDWLGEHATPGNVIGYDPKLHTKKQVEAIQDKLKGSNVTLKALSSNVIDIIWTDRPESPVGPVELFPDKIAGATSAQKRTRIAASLKQDGVTSVVITPSDSICWLLNTRGSDIDFNPVVLSYAILHAVDARIDWYVDAGKVSQSILSALGASITIHPLENFENDLKGLGGVVQYDDQRSSIWIYHTLRAAGVDVVTGKDPCVLPKACKTESEQLSIRQAHIRDGVALVRFLFWLEAQDVSNGQLTELIIEEKLEEYRRGDPTYRGPSFSTIAGWAGHGAIIHYRATPESNAAITGNNFLLLDSGGQYEYGTTDITRTIVIGDVTAEMKDRFTRVLKGHIALASAKFAPELDGAALDNLARQPLIDEGLNFAHGTGHGVGCFMCVHEESSSISPRGKDRLRPGMLVSNEPGYYKEGEYGIRHENLILCQENSDGTYSFDTVTIVPFDTRGIDWDLMSEAEVVWLENYHRHVFDTLSPFLGELELSWLEGFLFPKEQHDNTEEDL
jgi:Xaa-Pro aminopeptidase